MSMSKNGDFVDQGEKYLIPGISRLFIITYSFEGQTRVKRESGFGSASGTAATDELFLGIPSDGKDGNLEMLQNR